MTETVEDVEELENKLNNWLADQRVGIATAVTALLITALSGMIYIARKRHPNDKEAQVEEFNRHFKHSMKLMEEMAEGFKGGVNARLH